MENGTLVNRLFANTVRQLSIIYQEQGNRILNITNSFVFRLDQYRILLYDGRNETVTNHIADANSGNVSEVTYKGHATYRPATQNTVSVEKEIKVAPAYAKAQIIG